MRFRKLRPYLVTLGVILSLYLGLTYFIGPLDSIPRLRATAQSPDGSLLVNVYKQRLALYPKPRVGILVRIYENGEKLVYEKIIFEDGLWDHDIGEMYQNIYFNDSEILIGPKYSPEENFVIKRADLKAGG